MPYVALDYRPIAASAAEIGFLCRCTKREARVTASYKRYFAQCTMHIRGRPFRRDFRTIPNIITKSSEGDDCLRWWWWWRWEVAGVALAMLVPQDGRECRERD